MPGPSVVVCQGDTVVAEIVNKLHTETTTIHWHGKFFLMNRVIHFLKKFHLGEHMKGNQYMDGTPHVTQCPILPSAKFVMKFVAQER